LQLLHLLLLQLLLLILQLLNLLQLLRVHGVCGYLNDSNLNNKDIILFLTINYKRIINTFLITHSLTI
jgi:hypothetical protein